MHIEQAVEVEEHEFCVVCLNFCVFVKDYGLEIELEVLILSLSFKFFNDLIRGNKIEWDHCEEIHSDFWS